jgi:pimeloyl-ACP methyl ester carboxylesterase
LLYQESTVSAYIRAETKTVKVNGLTFAYRELGPKTGVPVVFLHHLTAGLDDWDPSVVDGIAESHHVIAFDNRGVGRSEGQTPDDVHAMAHDAEAFVDALGLKKVDLFGYSLGGFIAQVIAKERPTLVRKIILAGTGPAGGAGIAKIGEVLQTAMQRSAAEKKHPKAFLFFTPSVFSQKSAGEFLTRLSERSADKDAAVSNETIQAQAVAITKWGTSPANDLKAITQPVLVANGDDDTMFPTVNSFELYQKLPNATLSIFPDASHGGIFQYHGEFVRQAVTFLDG